LHFQPQDLRWEGAKGVEETEMGARRHKGASKPHHRKHISVECFQWTAYQVFDQFFTKAH
jgi:hypothetical protein